MFTNFRNIHFQNTGIALPHPFSAQIIIPQRHKAQHTVPHQFFYEGWHVSQLRMCTGRGMTQYINMR